jgi:hypothetical protein
MGESTLFRTSKIHVMNSGYNALSDNPARLVLAYFAQGELYIRLPSDACVLLYLPQHYSSKTRVLSCFITLPDL